MKARGYIALLLLTLYLAAVGTPAYVSLTCKCKAPREALQHTGCTCCDHTGDLPAARADITAPCCGTHHSTDIALYTGSGLDHERLVRCVVLTLPPAIVATCGSVPVSEIQTDRQVGRDVPPLRDGFARCAGLRAPPVRG